MSNSQIVVSADFPHRMSRKQLQVAVNDYLSKVRDSGSQENVVIQCYPLIALGLGEIQARQNKVVTWLSILVAIVSLIVAAIALKISIDVAHSSDKSSDHQIELLKDLNKNVLESQKAIQDSLGKLQVVAPPQQTANPAVKRDAPKAARPLP